MRCRTAWSACGSASAVGAAHRPRRRCRHDDRRRRARARSRSGLTERLRRPRRGRCPRSCGQRRRDRRPDRTERLRQDHRAQSDLRRAAAGRRRDPVRRAGDRGLPAHRIARLGARAHVPARARARRLELRRECHGRPRVPCRRCRAARCDARARGCCARVGLADTGTGPAAELTYIDQKRLELARALALDPACCCSTNGSPGSIRPNFRSASR